MAAPTCLEFLQWALPRLGLSWPGFRRVRRQVGRRVGHRVQELGLSDLGSYRDYLEQHPEEWGTLDSFCRIPISRFQRDRTVFERLGAEVLPALATEASGRDPAMLRCWSAGCASGEEPYSLSILWQTELASRFPALTFHLVATDIDDGLLERARLARYRKSSLRELPPSWIGTAFRREGDWYELKPEYRAGIEFLRQDIRRALPGGSFDLVLCRNLAFTYFDPELRRHTAERILSVLRPGGGLVIGRSENLPEGLGGLEAWVAELRIYRKVRRS